MENDKTGVEREKLSSGTGTVYSEDKDSYYILTAGHVIDKKKIRSICAEFFINGRNSRPLKAKIKKLHHKYGTTTDLAILELKKTEISDYPQPTIIPLEQEDYKVKGDMIIMSSGCPNGDWPSIFVGKVNYTTADSYVFTPNVLGGRSGSAIFNINGTKIIGMVIWKTPNGGTSINLKQIYHLSNLK